MGNCNGCALIKVISTPTSAICADDLGGLHLKQLSDHGGGEIGADLPGHVQHPPSRARQMFQHLRSVALLGGVGGLRDFRHRLAVLRSSVSQHLAQLLELDAQPSEVDRWCQFLPHLLNLDGVDARVWSYRAGVTGDGVLIAGHEITVDVRVDDIVGGL